LHVEIEGKGHVGRFEKAFAPAVAECRFHGWRRVAKSVKGNDCQMD